MCRELTGKKRKNREQQISQGIANETAKAVKRKLQISEPVRIKNKFAMSELRRRKLSRCKRQKLKSLSYEKRYAARAAEWRKK